MNKKVVLSVLATAVVASMAASAFAAPKTGLYIGGNVKKFYSNNTLINMTKDARATYQKELKTAGFQNLVFVNIKGQGATIKEMFDLGTKVALADPLKPSDFLDSYGVVQNDGTVSGTEEPGKHVDPVPTGDLKVESVSAIDSTSFKVTFNKEVAGVLPSNFTVTQKDNSTRFYVQSATIAEDKKSATVTVYDALAENKVYTVATAGIKDANGVTMTADNDEFTYVKAIPASITLAAKLPQSGSVDLDEYVTVKDAAGNVIKSGFTVKFTSNVSVGTGNVISTSGLTSVTVNASITKADGSVVTTGNVVVPVEAAAAASVNEFKLVSGSTPTEVASLFLDATKVLDKDGKAIAGASATNLDLKATFKDQFGKDITITDAVYESLTPTVLSVTTTGDVTPVSVGKGLVRVTKGTVTKTIELEVKANPAITAIEAQDTLSVVGSSTSPAGSLKVALKDQYGRAFNGTVNITNSDATVITVNGGTATATTTNGEVTLAVQGLKEGSAKVTLTVGTVKKEVTVTSTKAGAVSNYAIDVTDASIDLNSGASDATATIKVYEVDASGNKTKEISTDYSITYELPATGSLIKATTGAKNVFENATSNTTAGSTVVTVKNGTLTLGTATINVVNTTDSVKSVEVVNPLVKVDTTGTFNLDELAKNVKMVTKSGKELNNTTDLATKAAAIDEVLTSNSAAVTVTSKTTVALATVDGAAQTATLTIKFKDTSIAPVAFNVEVTDKTVPAKPSLTTATVKGGANVTIADVAAGYTAWLAPAGTTTFTAGSTMTKLAGTSASTDTTIVAPAASGTYKLFLVDAAGNVSAGSDNDLTVDATAPSAEATAAVTRVADTATVDATDKITITFTENLSDDSQTAVVGYFAGEDAFGASGTRATVNFTDDKTAVITLGTGETVSAGDTITIAKENVVDVVGNTATANVEVTIGTKPTS